MEMSTPDPRHHPNAADSTGSPGICNSDRLQQWTSPPPSGTEQMTSSAWAAASSSPPNTTSFFSHDSTYFFGAPGTFGSSTSCLPGPHHTDSDSEDESQSDLKHALIDSLLEPLETKSTDPSDELYLGSSVLKPMPVSNAISYASKLSTSPSPVPNIGATQTPQPNHMVPSAKICPFFLQNSCRYANHCRYRHDFGAKCPQCGEDVPLDEQSQEIHVLQCTETLQLAEEKRHSSLLQCEICFEEIVRSGRRFGLLQGCSHAFCLPCIRNWRGSAGQTKENLRACPMCRQDSFFVIPSDRMVMNPMRKARVIDKYTCRLRQIECKWFARGKGTCPFGSSCFYAHLLENGSVAEPERLQHGANADGLVEVMKPMRLADFFG